MFVKGGSANPADGGGVNYESAAFEELVVKAAQEQDPAKRVELYAQAEELFVKTDAAIIPIYWYTRVTVTKPNVTRTFGAGGQEAINKWDISK